MLHKYRLYGHKEARSYTKNTSASQNPKFRDQWNSNGCRNSKPSGDFKRNIYDERDETSQENAILNASELTDQKTFKIRASITLLQTTQL